MADNQKFERIYEVLAGIKGSYVRYHLSDGTIRSGWFESNYIMGDSKRELMRSYSVPYLEAGWIGMVSVDSIVAIETNEWGSERKTIFRDESGDREMR